MVGIWSWEMEVRVPRREVRKFLVLVVITLAMYIEFESECVLFGCECSSFFQVCACAETGVYIAGEDECSCRACSTFGVYAIYLVCELGKQLS